MINSTLYISIVDGHLTTISHYKIVVFELKLETKQDAFIVLSCSQSDNIRELLNLEQKSE